MTKVNAISIKKKNQNLNYIKYYNYKEMNYHANKSFKKQQQKTSFSFITSLSITAISKEANLEPHVKLE